MSSEDSDDEPLSILAAAKKENPEKFVTDDMGEPGQIKIVSAPMFKKRKMKRYPLKKLPITFNLGPKHNDQPALVVQRPADVWLYLKDLNPFGPYSCLLCSEWFVSRGKLIIHYVLNHRKDFCGVCRYFVADREAWQSHLNFHSPWPCSQCTETFTTESEVRQHLSNAHNLVHCRLCHFRVHADQYDAHLFQKHNVTNVSNKDEEVLWEIENEGSKTFYCLVCYKSDNLSSEFFNHYMGIHHFTLKCFARMISGNDPPFSVSGVEVSHQFLESLKDHRKYGYVDLDKSMESESQEQSNRDNDLLNATEIKQENLSDDDGEKSYIDDKKEDKSDQAYDVSCEYDRDGNKLEANEVQRQLEIIRAYKGDEDFDVTLMEIIIPEQCYFDYINEVTTDMKAKIMPETSYISYDNTIDVANEMICPLCDAKQSTLHDFSAHMQKVHCVKFVPVFCCRVCATTFENQHELDTHTSEELGEFEDLWMCQFCDKEFDNREETRRHMTDHWEFVEYDNCFSPHLGFKCRYCPTLFWNEEHRENHQIRVHYQKHKEQYYRCECSELYSDKIWFIHHYVQKHRQKNSRDLYLLKCYLCCIVLRSVEEMRNHFGIEHPEARKIFCSLDGCQYRPLSHKKSFQLHLRAQHTTLATNRSCSCSICGREFPNARSRSAHVAKVHGTGRYRCKICGDMLQSMDERKLHYLISHPGHNPYKCTECGKSFQYKSSLYIHKQQHSPNKQTYTCSYCQKVFAKKDSHREHVQIHEGPRHACSYCPMRFVQRSNMLRHERRHTGERPYVCTQCPRTFSDKGACTSHIRTHMKTAPFSCVYCGQTFVQKSKLTYHIRKHTGENLETCTVCSKMFTSACSLREHMKIHETKILTVKCPLCDRKYQDERNMLRHMRTSHTRGQYNCPLCNKVLSSSAGLRIHVLTHSATSVFKCKLCKKTYAVQRSMLKHVRKRHNLKNVNLREFYTALDPRDCQLNLDEEVITKIFGPRKTKDSPSRNFTFVKGFSNKNTKAAKAKEQTAHKDQESDDESEEWNDQSKDEGTSGDEQELEPTDFVTVKIEPFDEYENNK